MGLLDVGKTLFNRRLNIHFLGYILGSNRVKNVVIRSFIDSMIFLRFFTFSKLLNYLQNVLEMKCERITLKSLPPRIYIETTNFCNLKCPYCVAITRPVNAKGTMSDEMFLSVLKELKNTLFSVRLYNQGDPFVDKFLLTRLKLLKENKVSSILATNFSMPLKREYINELVTLRPDHIVICFESLRNEIYQKYRIGGDINIVKMNIKHLVEEKRRQKGMFPFISLRIFLTNYNKRELEDIYTFYKESGVDNLLFVPMMIDMTNPEAVEEWLPSNSYLQKPASIISCPELWYYPIINFEGKIIPCCLISNYENNLGSLKDHSFSEIWNSKPYCDARKIFIKRANSPDIDNTNICVRCRGRLKTCSDPTIDA